jgi:hypothetical protein
MEQGKPDAYCMAEIDLANEFPELYEFYSNHPVFHPEGVEAWARFLSVSRNCKPILDDIRLRGLNLARLDQYTPAEVDRTPLFQGILEWLPKIQDPLTLSICLGRLLEPRARPLVKKGRELLLSLAREWNGRLRDCDKESTLSVLAQCLMRAVLERDVPEVLTWVRDRSLSAEARCSYVIDLERFARKPGGTRDALLELCRDGVVGRAAVWAIGGALKADALPLMYELRDSSQHELVRKNAATVAKKIEARIRKESRSK